MRTNILRLMFTLILLAGCSSQPETDSSSADTRFAEFLDAEFQRQLSLSPMHKQRLGDVTASSSWDNFSTEFTLESARQTKRIRDAVLAFPRDRLNTANQLNYDLLLISLDRKIALNAFPYHRYPVNTRNGIHLQIVEQLLIWHPLHSAEDARAYINRLNALPAVAAQITDAMNENKRNGVIAPRFTLQRSAKQMEELLVRQPLTNYPAGTHLLIADFNRRIDVLDISEAEKSALRNDAISALRSNFRQALESLRDTSILQSSQAEEYGAWNLPNGGDYYRALLLQYTDSDITPDRLHQVAQYQIEDMKQQISGLIPEMGYHLSIGQFFGVSRRSPRLGVAADNQSLTAVERVTAVIDEIAPLLPRLFQNVPRASLQTEIIDIAFSDAEPLNYDLFRSRAAAGGKLQISLSQLNSSPDWQIKAATYANSYPGAHMQAAIAEENETLPRFRRSFSAPAYIEGWRLYAEYLPAALGLYSEPTDKYGHLVRDLVASVLVAVDTGVHHKRWSRDRAAQFVLDNTPVSREEADRMVRNVLINPAAATAAKMGQLKFLDLREVAKEKLGDRFDPRRFHQFILQGGPMPLNMLDREVSRWIVQQKQQ